MQFDKEQSASDAPDLESQLGDVLATGGHQDKGLQPEVQQLIDGLHEPGEVVEGGQVPELQDLLDGGLLSFSCQLSEQQVLNVLLREVVLLFLGRLFHFAEFALKDSYLNLNLL